MGAVFLSRNAAFVVKGDLLPAQPRLPALAQLQQNETGALPFCVPQKPQPFGLQMERGGQGDDLSQPLWAMDEIEISAVFQGPGGAFQELCQGAAVLPPGQRCSVAQGASGKIGRIADTEGKAALWEGLRYLPQVRTYTLHTGLETIGPDVSFGRPVGVLPSARSR